MLEQDLYEILGVKKTATDKEIQKAFRVLAKKHHPDVTSNNKESEKKFKEINFAYEVLKDPKKRAQYDQMRAQGANPFAHAGAQQGGRGHAGPFGPEAYADFGLGDLFEEIFGGTAGFRGGRQTRGGRAGFSARGADRETILPVSFLDAARGAERLIELSHGKRLTVKIPEGVESGTKIKLAGQGDPGMGGGPAGDLIIQLEVQPHPQFAREGLDIISKIPITFSEAVLGGEVDIPTLDSKVVMKIPKGVSSGQRLKLSGKGIRSTRTSKVGDQYVEIVIKVPKNPDAEYLEAAEKLKSNSFNPRS
jgi:curved DNA-binding protein